MWPFPGSPGFSGIRPPSETGGSVRLSSPPANRGSAHAKIIMCRVSSANRTKSMYSWPCSFCAPGLEPHFLHQLATVLRSGMARTSFPASLPFTVRIPSRVVAVIRRRSAVAMSILHGLVDAVAADHQHMGPAQIVSRHIQPVLVFLGNLVLEEGGQEQNRADGRIPGVVHLAAVGGSVLGVLILVVAPGSRNVGKSRFMAKSFLPVLPGNRKAAVYQPPVFIS